jgi:hypothetical protein
VNAVKLVAELETALPGHKIAQNVDRKAAILLGIKNLRLALKRHLNVSVVTLTN